MTTIHISRFSGERPKISPRLLPNEMSALTKGCHFDHGNITSIKSSGVSADTVPSNTKTLLKYLGEHWFSWSGDVNAVNSPVANDDWQRVYFTGDGYPKVTNNAVFSGSNMPNVSYRLGVKAPETKPSAVLFEPSGEDIDFNDDETRFYTHTFVTEQGEEGPPGESSDAVELTVPDHESTFVTLTLAPPVTNQSNITHRRIYRSATGGGVDDYFFVAEIPISQTTFVDRLLGDQLGDTLQTYSYVMPPAEMKGMVSMANGILAGFTGNTVCFSMAYLPYAWPESYQMTTEHDIVALVPIGNSLVALTKGNPYIFSGSSPESMTGQKIESNQACVSKRSAILVGSNVIYASPDGLVQIGSSGTQLLTESIITREQWQALSPQTMEAYSQELNYIGFYGASLDKAFVFSPRSGDFRHVDAQASYGYSDLVDDALYFGHDGAISVFGAGTDLTDFVWRSKEYTFADISFSCAVVKGPDISQVGIRFFVDGVEVFDKIPGELDVFGFRLPPERGQNWQIEVYGKGEVEEIALSTSMAELGAVING